MIIAQGITEFLNPNGTGLQGDQTACEVIEGSILNSCGQLSVIEGINAFTVVQVALSLVFAGIILLGIFYIIKAAAIIMRGEGDEKKVEEGQKIVKGVYIGIIIIILGIIGIFVVSVLFGANGFFSQDIPEPDNIDEVPIFNN
jgi:heme/copper-type cytochrome/quinol oxidase subunit 2